MFGYLEISQNSLTESVADFCRSLFVHRPFVLCSIHDGCEMAILT